MTPNGSNTFEVEVPPHLNPNSSTSSGLSNQYKAAAPKLCLEYKESIPGPTDPKFLDFVIGTPNDTVPTYQLRENEYIAHPEKIDQPFRDKSASYGRGGITASSNAFAILMQITRFLGVGSSGFFAVNLRTTPDPYMIQERADRLMELAQDDQGIGVIFSNISDEIQNLWSEPWNVDFLHSRWPRYKHPRNDRLSITCQHFVSNGTVFVRTQFQAKSSTKSTAPMFTCLRFQPSEYHIRELDFRERDSSFNESQAQQSHALGPHGRSVILINTCLSHPVLAMSTPDYHNTVCLITAVSVNGELQEFEEAEDRLGYHYRVKSKFGADFTVTPSQPLEVIEAYRLQLVPKNADWRDCVIPRGEFLKMEAALSSEQYGNVQFSHDPCLNYITHRNLEHILSVCSIPVPLQPEANHDLTFEFTGDPEHELENNSKDWKLALTCGDISGHRLVTSASFFAFEFLLAIYTFLKPRLLEDDLTYHFQPCQCNSAERLLCEIAVRRRLRKRIEQTCRAHLAWVEHAKVSQGCYNTHYWATGNPIGNPILLDDEYEAQSFKTWTNTPSKMWTDTPFKMWTDTPFQILKFADAADVFEEHKPYVRAHLDSIVRPWIRYLDKNNKRGFFTFSRTTGMPSDGYHNYRLEDHVWIWSALQVVEKLGLGQQLKKQCQDPMEKMVRRKSNFYTISQDRIHDSLSWDYTPSDFRRTVLRKFTAQNPVSRQRMLAVGRSLSDTRYLFRCRDTALFHDTKTAFFNRRDEVFQATIDAQKYHLENQDSSWDSPLRYALALLMASKGHQINSKPTREMFKIAKSVLSQATSASGMIPGQLNVGTKEPDIFDDRSRRDFYWHASFETVFVLWQLRSFIEGETLVPNTRCDDISEGLADTLDPLKGNIVIQKELEMRKSMPYIDLMDQRNIVEVSDEWLYKAPEFLEFTPDIESTKEFIDYVRSENLLQHPIEAFYELEPRSLLRGATFSFMQEPKPVNENLKGVVIDIPRFKTSSSSQKRTKPRDQLASVTILSCHQIFNILKERRTADKAKKRLIWSLKVDADFGLLCLLASPSSEQQAMAAFFDRHHHREKYFFDETMAAVNVWNTEFHLSSFQLVEVLGSDALHTDLKFLGSNRRVRRGGMGFRFVGDYFDRFWTCHVLEYEPKDDLASPAVADRNHISARFDALIKDTVKSKEINAPQPWRQRKVLELLLFNRMLEKILGRYKQMLEEIDNHLRMLLFNESRAGALEESSHALSISNAIFSSQMDSYLYLKVYQQWPPLEYTLQIMEEDLKTTLEKIELWNNRERDRRSERPRWTRNDEIKYRSAITLITTANNQKIRDLEHYHSRVRSLRESLAQRLESTRNDLSFQGAENVRYFTYVTVVFLPLGFGASTMSTSSAPSGRMALNIFIAVIITFVPTIVALVYASEIVELFNSLRHVFRKLLVFLLAIGDRPPLRADDRLSSPGSINGKDPNKLSGKVPGSVYRSALTSKSNTSTSEGRVHGWKLFVKEAKDLPRKVHRRRKSGHTKNNERELEAGIMNRLKK